MTLGLTAGFVLYVLIIAIAGSLAIMWWFEE